MENKDRKMSRQEPVNIMGGGWMFYMIGKRTSQYCGGGVDVLYDREE